MADERNGKSYENGVRDATLQKNRADIDTLFEHHEVCKAACSRARADIYGRIEATKEAAVQKIETLVKEDKGDRERDRNVLIGAMIGSNLGGTALISIVLYLFLRAMA